MVLLNKVVSADTIGKSSLAIALICVYFRGSAATCAVCARAADALININITIACHLLVAATLHHTALHLVIVR